MSCRFLDCITGSMGRNRSNRSKPHEVPRRYQFKTYAKTRSDKKLFQILNGLDRKFEPIKREILRVNPLPTAEAAYTTIRKEAAHQNILGATNNEPQGIATDLIARETEGVGFMTKGYCQNDDKKKWVTKDVNLTLNVKNVACRGTQKNNASVLSDTRIGRPMVTKMVPKVPKPRKKRFLPPILAASTKKTQVMAGDQMVVLED
ncbi:hypothetical protein Tco_0329044 [Tanacetum coccineum]